MEECIDVSFKAYLSFLYLRNETCLISFVIGRSVSHVSLQGVMEKVDKMCKVGEAIELDSVVEFDFKLDELFYLRELSNFLFIQDKIQYFSAMEYFYMNITGLSVEFDPNWVLY